MTSARWVRVASVMKMALYCKGASTGSPPSQHSPPCERTKIACQFLDLIIDSHDLLRNK